MGGANNICSDKTGTLTTNSMTVKALLTESTIHTRLDPKNISDNTLKILCEGYK